MTFNIASTTIQKAIRQNKKILGNQPIITDISTAFKTLILQHNCIYRTNVSDIISTFQNIFQLADINATDYTVMKTDDDDEC